MYVVVLWMMTCDEKVVSNMWLWCVECGMTFKGENF